MINWYPGVDDKNTQIGRFGFDESGTTAEGVCQKTPEVRTVSMGGAEAVSGVAGTKGCVVERGPDRC